MGATRKSECDPTRSNDIALLELRKQNTKLLINRLPSEILSYIMLIGVDYDRRVWRWEPRSVGSQQVASQVCCHWRNIAISTPILWTFIHIFRIPPNEYTAIYIARTGSTALLDIFVDLRHLNSFIPPTDNASSRVNTQPIFNMLQLLTMLGAGANRWRTLYLRSSGSEILPVFVNFLNSTSPSCLRLLRLQCGEDSRYEDDLPEAVSFMNSSSDINQASDQSHILLGSSLSNLRDLELVSVSWPLFVKHMTTLPALRTLSITASTPYSTELANVLLSNPQLESLYIKSKSRREDQCDPSKLNLIQPVVLSSLRSLYIHAENGVPWALRMLATIKAPVLHHLAIKYYDPFTSSQERGNLVSYISSGGNSPHHRAYSISGWQPAYPSIRSLDISQFPCTENEFTTLVASFPLLSHVTIRRKQAEWLSGALWMLPKLESISAPQWTAEIAMNSILQTRVKAGIPINLAMVRKGCHKLVAVKRELSDAQGHLTAIPQYEYYKYDLDPEIRGDWQGIQWEWGRLNNGLDMRIEYDDYDSEYDSEGYYSDDQDDRLQTFEYNSHSLGNE